MFGLQVLLVLFQIQEDAKRRLTDRELAVWVFRESKEEKYERQRHILSREEGDPKSSRGQARHGKRHLGKRFRRKAKGQRILSADRQPPDPCASVLLSSAASVDAALCAHLAVGHHGAVVSLQSPVN